MDSEHVHAVHVCGVADVVPVVDKGVSEMKNEVEAVWVISASSR